MPTKCDRQVVSRPSEQSNETDLFWTFSDSREKDRSLNPYIKRRINAKNIVACYWLNVPTKISEGTFLELRFMHQWDLFKPICWTN